MRAAWTSGNGGWRQDQLWWQWQAAWHPFEWSTSVGCLQEQRRWQQPTAWQPQPVRPWSAVCAQGISAKYLNATSDEPHVAQQFLLAQQAPRSHITLTVGVYFGTFDPIHENHIAVAKFALNHGWSQIVYLVVNGDNPIKPMATPYERRLHLVQRRLAEEEDERLRCLTLHRNELTNMGWSGRRRICARVKRDTLAEYGVSNADVVQLIGQDSFEQALERSSAPSHVAARSPQVGIFSTRDIRFLVFPRGGAAVAKSVRIPVDLKDRVTVVEDYEDPMIISSTAVRQAAACKTTLAGVVHPRLEEEVTGMYALGNRFLLLFIGPPGSGKTSLGHALGKSFGFRHISGGDVFRAANARASRSALRRIEGQKQTVAKVFTAIAKAVSKLAPAPVSFDGFLPKDLEKFEEIVGMPALAVNLECCEEVLLERLRRRGTRRHDVARNSQARIANFVRQRSSFTEELTRYDSNRGIVKTLCADAPWDQVLLQLLNLVKQCSQQRGFDLPKVELKKKRGGSHIEADATVVDEAFWTRILEEIEASPRESYNSRHNAACMKSRGGSRSLKNFNNLVKAVLIDWSLRQVAFAVGGETTGQQPLCVEVLDVASGRGGDQQKFALAALNVGLRLCYTAIDVAEAQVEEARRRMTTKRDTTSVFACARYFVGDASIVAPCIIPSMEPLPWQQVVSVQFALHYFFGSESKATLFLQNATHRLCAGGILLLTTVNASKLASLAERALDHPDLTAEHDLFRVTFSDQLAATNTATRRDEYGMRYRFAMTSEGIDCEEFVVPYALLRNLLNNLAIDLIAAVPFTSLANFEGVTSIASEAVARILLQELGAPSNEGVDYSVYDRLGLRLSRMEVEVAELYTAYVGRRRSDAEASQPSMVQAVEDAARAVTNQSRGSDGDILRNLPAIRLDSRQSQSSSVCPKPCPAPPTRTCV